MGKHAQYIILEDGPNKIILKDIGPWDRYLTVTNDAEYVVSYLHSTGRLSIGKRLLYYDSEGDLTELVYDGNKFITFNCPEGRI